MSSQKTPTFWVLIYYGVCWFSESVRDSNLKSNGALLSFDIAVPIISTTSFICISSDMICDANFVLDRKKINKDLTIKLLGNDNIYRKD